MAAPKKEDIEAQIEFIEESVRNGPRGGRTKKRREFFRRLCEAALEEKFTGRSYDTLGIKIYEEVHKEPQSKEVQRKGVQQPVTAVDGDHADAAEHLLRAVVTMVNEYYAPSEMVKRQRAGKPPDRVRILFELRNYCPKFTVLEAQEPPPSEDPLDRFSCKLHHYHLTRDDRGAFWIYTVLPLEERVDQPRQQGDLDLGILKPPYLQGAAPLLPDHTYHFEARLAGSHLIIHLHRPPHRPIVRSDISVEIYPFAADPERVPDETYYGASIIHTWDNTLATSMAILSQQPLDGMETLERGRVPLRYEAVLQHKWEEGTKTKRLPGMPPGEVQVHPKFPEEEIHNRVLQFQRFTACFAWFPHLPVWETSFRQALGRGASVRVLMAHPDSEFAKSRGAAALKDPQGARRSIIEAREHLKNLRRHGGELKVWLTDRVLPLSYLEIDDQAYFSGFWSDCMSIDGLWFSTSTDSFTGKFLAAQFKAALEGLSEDDLSEMALISS